MNMSTHKARSTLSSNMNTHKTLSTLFDYTSIWMSVFNQWERIMLGKYHQPGWVHQQGHSKLTHQVQVQCCFTSTELETITVLGTGSQGRPPPPPHSSSTLNWNWNGKTLIPKDSSVRSIWTSLTASPCYVTNTNKHNTTDRERELEL